MDVDAPPVALQREVMPMGLATQRTYRVRRSFWSIFDRKFYVETLDGQPILFVKHPVFRWRAEFSIYTDETERELLYRLKARQVIAINFNYELVDAKRGALLATIQRKGWRSIVRDKFHIFDPNGEALGTMEEQGHSLLRRFFPILLAKYEIVMHGVRAAYVRQLFRFFNREFEIELTEGKADARFVLACALLAIIAEAQRENSN